MMNRKFKAVILYGALVLATVALLLSLFVFLAPTMVFHESVALLKIVPSASAKDGVSLFLGAVGSCARLKNGAAAKCTGTNVAHAEYDLSALPKNAPLYLLDPPPSSTPVFIAMGLAVHAMFFITFCITILRYKMEKIGGAMGSSRFLDTSAVMGFLGLWIGLTAYFGLRMWFGKTVDDFNAGIQSTNQGVQLVASLGDGFTMIWVALAFWAVPVIIALTKYHHEEI